MLPPALVAALVMSAVACRGGDDSATALVPQTITVSLDGLEGFGGLGIDAWVLPLDAARQEDAYGGARIGPADSDPFSMSDVIHPQHDDRYWDVKADQVVTFDPGTYRFTIEAFVPSGAMHFGCETLVRVVEGEPLVVTITSLPSYSGGGFHWTSPDELRYPDCPD